MQISTPSTQQPHFSDPLHIAEATVIRRIQDGSINVKPLLSAVAKLEDGAGWFKRLYDNKEGLLNVVLTP